MGFVFNPFTGNLDKVSVEDLTAFVKTDGSRPITDDFAIQGKLSVNSPTVSTNALNVNGRGRFLSSVESSATSGKGVEFYFYDTDSSGLLLSVNRSDNSLHPQYYYSKEHKFYAGDYLTSDEEALTISKGKTTFSEEGVQKIFLFNDYEDGQYGTLAISDVSGTPTSSNALLNIKDSTSNIGFQMGATTGYGWIRAVDVGVSLNDVNLILQPSGTNANVGIGTTTPTALLELGNPISSNTMQIGRLSGKCSIKSTNSYLIMDSDGSATSLNHYTDDNVLLGYGGGNTIIGSGSTLTDYKLEVRGDVALSADNDLHMGDYTPTSASIFSMRIGIKTSTNKITGLDFKNSNSAGQVRFMARNSDDDYLAMTIAGSTNLYTYFGYSTAEAGMMFLNGVTDTDKVLVIGTIHAGDLVLGTDGTSRVLVSADDGFVGVNNDTPLTYLDVKGTGTESGFHLGTANNVGAWVTSIRDSQFTMSGGAEYGTSSWTARATESSQINNYEGTIYFRADTGLTVGNTFTPTNIMVLDEDGINVTGDIQENSVKLEDKYAPKDRVGFAARNSGTTVPATSWTRAVFTTEIEDTDNAWNGSVFTVPTGQGGMYEILGHATFTSITDGQKAIVGVEVNGALTYGGLLGRGTSGGTDLGGYGGGLRTELSAGDTVEMVVYCSNATKLYGTQSYCTFSCYKMR